MKKIVLAIASAFTLMQGCQPTHKIKGSLTLSTFYNSEEELKAKNWAVELFLGVK